MEIVFVAIGSLIGMFGLAALVLFIRDRLFGRRPPSPAEVRARTEAHRAKLLAPDWPAVEERLGQPVPAILRELYENHALLTNTPLEVRNPQSPDATWHIADFAPANAETMSSERLSVPPGTFCFATNGFGDPYFTVIDGDAGPVYVHYHDGDDIVLVANSLAEFLSWPHRPDPP